MKTEIHNYNNSLEDEFVLICDKLAEIIDAFLTEAESKVWHRHPVWFLDGNPTVGYSKQKAGLRLMFWSGADFNEEKLTARGEKFKDASVFFNCVDEINEEEIMQWLQKSRDIQWDYKNLVKRKGVLERLK